MKYLIISQYFWPENFKINSFAALLIEQGHEVDVLTGLPNYPNGTVFEEFKLSPKKYYEYNGIKIFRIPIISRGNNYFKLFLNYLSFIISGLVLGPYKLKGKKYDFILIFQLSPITVVIPAIFINYIKKAKMLLWVQDLWPQTLLALKAINASGLLFRLLNLLVKYIYNKCDLILVQSNSFKNSISKDLASNIPIEYFPNCAEPVFLHNQDVLPSISIPIRKDLFTILFAGNIGEAQDFPTIVDAMEILKHNIKIRWVIVGDGRRSDWLSYELKKRQLGSNVLQVGSFPLEQMPAFFKHANALLITLKNKEVFSMTLPGKFQSYLTAGIPIISMLNGECSDYVQKHYLGISCKAGDATQLANSVLSLLYESEANKVKMGLNCLKLSKEEFNSDLLINKFQKLCAELINN